MMERVTWRAREGVPIDGGGPDSLKNGFLEFSHEGGRNFP